MSRPTTTNKGKLRKVSCGVCDHFVYETLAQLRDFRRSEHCGLPMTVEDAEAFAITPEGREIVEAEAEHKWQRQVSKTLAEATIQLQCKCCGQPQSKEHSAELIHAWEVQNQTAYDGRELMLTYDKGLEREISVDPCKCGGDRYTAMRKRGKSKSQEAKEAIPF